MFHIMLPVYVLLGHALYMQKIHKHLEKMKKTFTKREEKVTYDTEKLPTV